mgnify:FL=1
MIQRRGRHFHAGQSLVEFALMLPILVLILIGVFDLGRAFHALITINNSGREAARYGTLHPSSVAGMQAAAIQEAANSGIDIVSGDVAITCAATNSAPPCPRDTAIVVQINYSYTPYLSFFFPTGIPIRSSVEMRIP